MNILAILGQLKYILRINFACLFFFVGLRNFQVLDVARVTCL